MNINLKSFLSVAGGIALIALAYSALSFSNAYSRSIQPSSFRSFAVSGDGKVVVIPDVAQFEFSVVTEGGKDLAALQQSNTTKTNQAIDFVKKQGVKDEDIKTQQYNVQPRYQYYNCNPVYPLASDGASRACPPPEIVGYSVTQSVQVKIRDFSKIGGIMSGVVSNGANQVSSLIFTLDDPASAESKARTEAIAEAQAKAKDVAKAGGFRLGRLLAIEEGGGFPPYYYDKAYGRGGDVALSETAALPAPTVQPGSQDVMVNVVLRYEIN